jgi:deazaflavin-dependent oxidoreductase (nitroreductase family)
MWMKILSSMNVFLYHLTRGALGSRMGGQSVLLLHTVGRKSGRPFTTPLNYYQDGENYVIVASNWGKENHPAWFYNLLQQGSTTIQVKAQEVRVNASQADGDDYDRLWKLVTSRNEFYARYQAKTSRKIPLMVLTPEK